ncbi:MAG: YeiH family putative sulfate export transporter [Bacteroidales bacterium]|nr:YeiH family putative sulfate export transporter [Bacteroidales bacterium]MDE6801289.1 YeiH family protein [Muribaculaceae bacterium]MDE6832291.1 YeiH family protein [Muribaculaceae bacterium]
MLHGILLIALFACAAFYIGSAKFFTDISFSPMIIGIILGMLYANSLRNHLPETWVPGIQFCSKRLLRIGIIFYGFRLTFQDIAAVGVAGIAIDAIIVTVTIIGGYLIGSRLLKMDRETAMLTSVGSGICGAAAVLGAEATLRTKPYKTAVAVATVVIFGTLSMFIYPILYRTGALHLTPTEMGIYGGSTLHEVAHAVGAGNAMGDDIASTTVIVKMIRVMMLVPVLLILGVWAARRPKADGGNAGKGRVAIPWFAFGFLLVIAINSLSTYLNTLSTPCGLPESVVDVINYVDTFLLTMAMAALGAETSIDKFKKAGAKPFVLAFIIYIWLLGGGYLLARYLAPALL